MNQMAKTKNLKALAKKGNTIVEEAQITFSNPSLGNTGYEPEIVGEIWLRSLDRIVLTRPLEK